jgi:serine/threonine protein kinase
VGIGGVEHVGGATSEDSVEVEFSSPVTDQEPNPSGRPVAKVADFGLARNSLLVDQIAGSKVDNPSWLAPEILAKKEYDSSVDVYSFGVILWEMLSGHGLFEEVEWGHEVCSRLMAGERPPIPAVAPRYEGYRTLIAKCWHQDPSMRPSVARVRDCIMELQRLDASPNSPNVRRLIQQSASFVSMRGLSTLLEKKVLPSTASPDSSVHENASTDSLSECTETTEHSPAVTCRSTPKVVDLVEALRDQVLLEEKGKNALLDVLFRGTFSLVGNETACARSQKVVELLTKVTELHRVLGSWDTIASGLDTVIGPGEGR